MLKHKLFRIYEQPTPASVESQAIHIGKLLWLLRRVNKFQHRSDSNGFR
jgi:hypothetical protein